MKGGKIYFGARYGMLTALHRGPYKLRAERWWCRCDCGKERLVYGQSIRQRGMVSCGCVSRKKPTDFAIGDRFGSLTISSRDFTKIYTCWVCSCALCGNSTSRSSGALRNGSTDCGCVSRGHLGVVTPEVPEGAHLIPLTKGLFAVVDAADYAALKDFTWSVMINGYATRPRKRGEPRTSLMHRVITDAEPGHEVDHINGDRLDNRRANLRVCTRLQNAKNITSSPNQKRGGFKGVTLRRHTNKWVAQIQCTTGGSRRKQCASAEEAARLYDTWAREVFGEFAACNFPAPVTKQRCA